MTRLRFVVAAAIFAVAGVGAWWWFFGGAEADVSDQQARDYLARMVSAAQAGDFEALCRLNGSVGNCRRMIDTGCDPSTAPPAISCKDTVPREPPTIVDTRESFGDGSAGRILVVRGVDGAGQPYETEVLVFRENRHALKAVNAVYWSGATVVENALRTPVGG